MAHNLEINEQGEASFFVGGLTDEGIEHHYTKLIGGEWYYWDVELQQWKPETYKFEACSGELH